MTYSNSYIYGINVKETLLNDNVLIIYLNWDIYIYICTLYIYEIRNKISTSRTLSIHYITELYAYI